MVYGELSHHTEEDDDSDGVEQDNHISLLELLDHETAVEDSWKEVGEDVLRECGGCGGAPLTLCEWL